MKQALKIILMSRWLKAAVFIACLVPAVRLYWRYEHHTLGINWVEAAQRWTGDWILRFLIITLCITPLRKVPGLNPVIRYRRMLGLFAFFYALIHFSIYLFYDKQLDWLDMRDDFTIRRFYIFGLIAFLSLIPLAITSTKGWIRRLGPRWQTLHRLVYLAAASGAFHYYLQGKSFVFRAFVYCVIVALLLLYRVVMWLRKLRPVAGQMAVRS